MHTIYLVRKDSKPVYIGYTSRSTKERWSRHIRQAKKQPKYPIHHAIKKHGVDSFTIEALYESEDGDHTLNYMEHHYIWLYRTYWKYGTGGYNLTMGGEGTSSNLSEKERREIQRAYQKAYREANTDKLKARRKVKYQSKKDEIKARSKAYRKSNPDKIKACRKAYYESNQETIKAKAKVYQEANKDKKKAYDKAYREANKYDCLTLET